MRVHFLCDECGASMNYTGSSQNIYGKGTKYHHRCINDHSVWLYTSYPYDKFFDESGKEVQEKIGTP